MKRFFERYSKRSLWIAIISIAIGLALHWVEIYKVEKHFRQTMPVTVLVLVFIGVIVSSRKTKGGTGLQIALGFIISFIFIIFAITSRGIAEGGLINPAVAVWIPNVLFSGVGLLMYRYVPR